MDVPSGMVAVFPALDSWRGKMDGCEALKWEISDEESF